MSGGEMIVCTISPREGREGGRPGLKARSGRGAAVMRGALGLWEGESMLRVGKGVDI